jgi:uncharacterized membrane protein
MTAEIFQVIVLSMLPFSELRGGLPLAFAFGINPITAFLVAVAANIAVVPLIFLFLDYAHKHFMKIPPYARLFNHFLERTRRKAEKKLGDLGYFGLLLLVAVPLPVTGAYTGTLAAWFFELDRKKSMMAIAGGVVLAGIIVSTVVITGTSAFNLFIK